VCTTCKGSMEKCNHKCQCEPPKPTHNFPCSQGVLAPLSPDQVNLVFVCKECVEGVILEHIEHCPENMKTWQDDIGSSKHPSNKRKKQKSESNSGRRFGSNLSNLGDNLGRNLGSSSSKSNDKRQEWQ